MTNDVSIRPYNFRTGEGEFIDLNKLETATWLRAQYPAIMADRPVGMSEDYQFMDSKRVIRGMNKLGLGLVAIGQQHSRLRDPAGQEHFMRFRLPQDTAFQFKNVGDSVPELVVMNSHNGRLAIRAFAGIFRLVCSNGMVVRDSEFGFVKMRHFGEKNTMEAFGELLNQMARKIQVIDGRISLMRQTNLTPHQQNQLARELMAARGVPDWVEPAMVLEARRPEDQTNEDRTRSLWLTFNVLQENLTNVEISLDREGERRRSLRRLSGARADVVTNEKLWEQLDAFIDGLQSKGKMRKFDPIIDLDAEEAQEANGETDGSDAPTPRSVQELLKLATVAEIEAITDAERAQLSADDKKRLSSRKTYLKRKEAATAA